MLLGEPNANANRPNNRPTMFKSTQNLYYRTENVHESTKMYSYLGHRINICYVYSKNTFFQLYSYLIKTQKVGPFLGLMNKLPHCNEKYGII